MSESNTSDSDECSVGITLEQAANNYRMAGDKIKKEESSITWDRFGHLHSLEIDKLLKQVLNEIQFDKRLSDFQEIFLHSLGSRKDTVAVVSTGAGKTVATGIAALLLRKVFKEPLGLVVIFIPLSGSWLRMTK